MAVQSSGDAVLMVTEAFRQRFGSLCIGDIVLTPGHLYYFGYRQIMYTGKIGGVVGAMMGGIIGTIAQGNRDKEALETAVAQAVQDRLEKYGKGLDERLQKNDWDMKLGKEEIAALSLGGDGLTIVCQTRKGESVEFVANQLDGAQRTLLQKYLTPGAELKSVADPLILGIGVKYPSHEQVLESLKKGETPRPEEDAALSKNENYMIGLYLLLHKAKKDDIISICRTLNKNLDSKIRALLFETAKQHLKEEAGFGKTWWMYGGVILFGAVLIAAAKDDNPANRFGTGALMAVMIVVFLLMLFWPKKASLIKKELSGK